MSEARERQQYTLTLVYTNCAYPHEIEEQWHLSGRDAAKAKLTDLLDQDYAFGRRANAVTMQHAETGLWLAGRWYGIQPFSIQVNSYRYDLDFGTLDHAGWARLRDSERRAREEQRLAARMRALNAEGITEIADVTAYAAHAVAAGHTVASLNSAVRSLGQ